MNKRSYATFESYRALFTWLHAEAVRRGYGTTKFKKVLFIADGAEVLWTLQATVPVNVADGLAQPSKWTDRL